MFSTTISNKPANNMSVDNTRAVVAAVDMIDYNSAPYSVMKSAETI